MMPQITIVTPTYGWHDVMTQSFAAVDAHMPASFRQVLVDDCSPTDQAEQIAACAKVVERDGQQVGSREFVSAHNLPGGSPNIARNVLHGFNVAKGDPECQALLILAYNSIIDQHTIPAFAREQQRGAGAVAPIFSYDGKRIGTFGGMDPAMMGYQRGQRISLVKPSQHKHAHLDWAHSACLWLPRATFMDKRIKPDLGFPMYFFDLDLTKQIKRTGRQIRCANVVVIRRKRGAATSLRFGKDKKRMHDEGTRKLQRKWG